MSNIAIIFAAGRGVRMNKKTPKQFLKIMNKPIIAHTIDIFEKSQLIDSIIIVSIKEKIDYIQGLIKKYNYKKIMDIVEGGKTALESQYEGLKYYLSKNPKKDDIVIIHDGVRPLIDQKTILDAIELTKSKGNAIAVTPASETISITKNNKIKSIITRESCLIVRAPQAFYFKDIYSAHLKAKKQHLSFVDSASMMKYFKYKLFTFFCPDENIKVTTEHDFIVCKHFLMRKKYD